MLECTRQGVHFLNLQAVDLNDTEDLDQQESAYDEFLDAVKKKITFVLMKNVSLYNSCKERLKNE